MILQLLAPFIILIIITCTTRIMSHIICLRLRSKIQLTTRCTTYTLYISGQGSNTINKCRNVRTYFLCSNELIQRIIQLT